MELANIRGKDCVIQLQSVIRRWTNTHSSPEGIVHVDRYPRLPVNLLNFAELHTEKSHAAATENMTTTNTATATALVRPVTYFV